MSTPAELVPALFRTIDAMDAPGFGRFLSEDVEFRFGNAPVVRGQAEAVAAVQGFFSSIAGLAHEIDQTWSDADSVICRGRVTYTRLDGTRISLHFADYFGFRDGQIRDYQIYIDINPLFAPAA